MKGAWAVVAVLAGMLTSGCIGSDSAGPTSDADDTPCVHPYPCGDGLHWPVDLAGPFDVLTAQSYDVIMDDGIPINIAVFLPDVPAGTRVPAVLQASPYSSTCSPEIAIRTGGEVICEPANHDPATLAFDHEFPRRLVENGTAFVHMDVRGTGQSSGCFSYNSPRENLDIGLVIDHVAEADWSNGRIGMFGLSYMGSTPWFGALQERDALKAILVAGIVVDEYFAAYTPNGAQEAPGNVPGPDLLWAGFAYPPPLGAGPEHVPTYAQQAPERVCPDTAQVTAYDATKHMTDARNRDFHEERRALGQLDEITAAVMVNQGLRDFPAHYFQDDYIWPHITAPKSMMLGQWRHEFPSSEQLGPHPYNDSWLAMAVGWFDYWLKGVGPVPTLDEVTFQEPNRDWHRDPEWPPSSSRIERLTFEELSLLADADSFIADHDTASHRPEPGCPIDEAEGLVLKIDAPASLLAGNPYFELVLESNLPGGVVSVNLHAGDECTYDNWLVGGGADLRFIDDPWQGSDFPTNSKTMVRVDIMNAVHRFDEGDSLLIVISGLGHFGYTGQPYAPTITVHPESSFLVPLLEGTWNGEDAGPYVPPPHVQEAVA